MAYIFYALKGFVSEKEIQRFLKYYIPTVLVLIFVRYQFYTRAEWREFQDNFYVAYYAVPFLLTVFAVNFCQNIFRNKRLWIFALSVLAVVEINHFYRIFNIYFLYTFAEGTTTFFMRLFYNIQCTVTYLLVPLIFYRVQKSRDGFWGLSFKKPVVKPYLFILLFVWISFF